MNFYDLIISTTAVNRPDLHTKTFVDYCSFMEGLSCLWLINIDCIAGGSTLLEAENNLKNILSRWNNISVVFSSINEDGGQESFYRSAQFLTNESVKIQSKYGVFWLEDDWGKSSDYKLKGILEQTNFSDMDYLALAIGQTSISGNPGIYGHKLLKEHVQPRINDESCHHYMHNPERAITMWKHSESDKPNPIIPENYGGKTYALPCFFDVGRPWAEQNVKEFQISSDFLIPLTRTCIGYNEHLKIIKDEIE